MDHIIAIALVLGAAIYLFFHFRQQFGSSNTGGCSSGCNQCSTDKWKAIEQEIAKQQCSTSKE